MPNNSTSPRFQYSKRAHMLGRLDGQMLAAAAEERDREIEDYLVTIPRIIAVPDAEWPPVDPLPNTLYLRLAP